MAVQTIGMIGMGVLIVLIFLRVPVGVAMGLVGFFGYASIDGWRRALSDARAGALRRCRGLYALRCVPLFIVMGDLALRAGMSAKLYRAARDCSLAFADRRPMRPSARAPDSARSADHPSPPPRP